MAVTTGSRHSFVRNCWILPRTHAYSHAPVYCKTCAECENSKHVNNTDHDQRGCAYSKAVVKDLLETRHPRLIQSYDAFGGKCRIAEEARLILQCQVNAMGGVTAVWERKSPSRPKAGAEHEEFMYTKTMYDVLIITVNAATASGILKIRIEGRQWWWQQYRW